MRPSFPASAKRVWVGLAAGALVLGAAATSPAFAVTAGAAVRQTDAAESSRLMSSLAPADTATETFGYTGAAQTWTVPAEVTSATFDVYGAGGGAFSNSTPTRGGRATATISVTPGESIEVYVGGRGRDVLAGEGSGGFNGGSTVGRMTGGGASDVRIGGTTLADRAVVAGGGGGGVSNCSESGPTGGGGGGLVGGDARYAAVCFNIFGQQPGSGGTQSEGGTNVGSPAAAGTLGSGGPSVGGGGGGGGGYYGGAGGVNTGGGGGGSGFGPDGTQFETGTREGDGLVEITYALPVRTVTVTTTGSGTGTISGGGLDCGGVGHTTCETEVTDGDQITLTATAAYGSSFGGFTGAGCTTSPCTFTVTSDTSVGAAFSRQQFGLSVTKDGSGSGSVTSSPAGIDCGVTCSAPVTFGTSVTLTASPAADSDFAGFTGGCVASGTTCTTTVAGATWVTATFTLTERTISVSTTGAGTGTVTGGGLDCGDAGHTMCETEVTDGDQITLTATAATGSDFGGFTGAGCSTSPCTFTVTADTSVEAAFALQELQFSVTRDGDGSGSVTSSPAGIDCGPTCTAPFTFGTSVTLTALPTAGSAFAGWSGAGCAGSGACTVAMTQAHSVVATFRLVDTDGDGLTDVAEVYLHRTDPLEQDTDGDGLTDGREVKGIEIGERFEICGKQQRRSITVRTNPLRKDTDQDGLGDGKEVRGYRITQRVTTRTGSFVIGWTRSNPTRKDTDRDGLGDRVEKTGTANKPFGLAESDPTKCDTDRDRARDGAEVRAGTNPSHGRSGHPEL